MSQNTTSHLSIKIFRESIDSYFLHQYKDVTIQKDPTSNFKYCSYKGRT